MRTPARVFWKDYQHQFPALASLAQDILLIPATRAGIEQLFNSAQDICYYHRGSLKPKTIQDLMMFMCTSKFEIEEDRRALMDKYLSHEEKQAKKEEKDIDSNFLEPISDTKEGNNDNKPGVKDEPQVMGNNDIILDHIQPLSEKARGKRQLSIALLPEIEEQDTNQEDETCLPPIYSTQVQHSGRVRKRSRLLNRYKSYN